MHQQSVQKARQDVFVQTQTAQQQHQAQDDDGVAVTACGDRARERIAQPADQRDVNDEGQRVT